MAVFRLICAHRDKSNCNFSSASFSLDENPNPLPLSPEPRFQMFLKSYRILYGYIHLESVPTEVRFSTPSFVKI